jgi:chromosome segregation ATPase
MGDDAGSVLEAQSTLGRLQYQTSEMRVRLHDQQAQYAAQEAQHTGRMGDLEVKIARLGLELKARNDEHLALVAVIQAQQDEVAHAGAIVTSAGSAQDVVKKLQAETQALHSEVTRLEAEKQAVGAEVASHRQVLGTHQASVDQALQNLEAVRAESARVAEELAGARRAYTTQGQALCAKEDAVASQALDVTAAHAQLEHTREEMHRTVGTKLAEAEARTMQAQVQMGVAATAAAEHQKARDGFVAQAGELAQLKLDLEQRAQGLAETTAGLGGREESIRSREASLAAQEGDLRGRMEAVTAREAAAEHLQAQLTEREQGLRVASVGMAEAQAQVKKLVQKHQLEAAGITIPDVP